MTDIKLPPMPKPHTPPVFATAANTQSVKAGYELGGYEKTPPLFDEHQLEAYAREAVRLNATVPEGWALVPVEPTLEMLEAGTYKIGVRDCYRAMLSAAPAAPQTATPDPENILLRQMLAIRVGGALLYTDDGELQDNSTNPCIDFKRDPAHEIHYKLKARAAAPQPAQPLTDEQFQKIRRSLMQQSGWDGDGWDQALKEAIEQAHGIGVKND